MGNCCGVTSSQSDHGGGQRGLEVSNRSTPSISQFGGVAGNMTPDSFIEPPVTEPQQLEHIADREGKKERENINMLDESQKKILYLQCVL